jgi:hypothetical protein
MRLYRGLKRPYRTDEVRPRAQRTGGTDFTDCPFTVLAYASGRNGVVLVLDVPDEVGPTRVTEETWFVDSARRFMVWGAFDRWVVAVIPAKELRAEVRRKGVAGRPAVDKGQVLRMAIERRLAGAAAARQDVPLSHPAARSARRNRWRDDRWIAATPAGVRSRTAAPSR